MDENIQKEYKSVLEKINNTKQCIQNELKRQNELIDEIVKV